MFGVSTAIETANYKELWSLLDSDYSKKVPKLPKKAREMIMAVVGLTYQRIDKKLLMEMVNVSNDDELNGLLKGVEGWKIEGDVIVLPLQAKNQSVPQATMSHFTKEEKIAILSSIGSK